MKQPTMKDAVKLIQEKVHSIDKSINSTHREGLAMQIRGIVQIMTGEDPGLLNDICEVYDALGVKYREKQEENYTWIICEYDEGWEE